MKLCDWREKRKEELFNFYIKKEEKETVIC